MHTVFSNLLMTLITAALPQLVAADKDKRPEGARPEVKREQPRDSTARGERPFNPEVMFKRLDANHDGVLKADEIPAGMPARLKEVLQHAIKNHDGKLSQGQFAEVLKENRPRLRPEGQGREARGQGRVEGRLGEPREGERLAERRGDGQRGRGPGGQWFGEGRGGREMAGRAGQPGWRPEAGPDRPWRGQRGPGWGRDDLPRSLEGRWGMGGPWQRYNMAQWDGMRRWGGERPRGVRTGRGPMGPQGPSAGLPSINPRAIFAGLDRDHDGTLSFEEFAAGMRRFHRMLTAGTPQRHDGDYSRFGRQMHRGGDMHQAWGRHAGWERGRHGWAMDQARAHHKGWRDGRRGQLAHWQVEKKFKGKPAMKSPGKQQLRKPEAKKPEGERKAVKPAAGGQEPRAVEARLVSMKRQLEERETALAKLKKVEESLKANLARLERQRDEMTDRLHRAEKRLNAKELAADGKAKPDKKSEKRPAGEKKPSKNL